MKLALALVLLTACGDSTPRVPLANDAPWPKFRADAHQTGRVDIAPTSTTGQLWSFQTGNGVFSSPIVAADGTIYIGSADRTFYALAADGSVRWSYQAGEIIDSAALLDDHGRVFVGAGDGHLRAFDAASGDLAWDFAADPPGGAINPSAIINWFEGNVTIGRDGTLYAGNDNFLVYGLDRETGSATWQTKVPDQTWSAAAVDPETDAIFVGNNSLLGDLGANVIALDGSGAESWGQRSWNGTVAASPLYTQHGLVVVGGFDGFVRALDPITGDVQWAFGTRDHIYASPAELPDGTIVQPSADGTIYGLDPATGTQRWAFDTLQPIRSSPAVDADGNIYVGSGEGKLFVLNADGTLRWSMQLVGGDRTDLNSSPALGRDAIYIGAEDGEVFSVPYDYCTRDAGLTDARCSIAGEGLPADGVTLRFTTGLGVPLAVPPAAIDPNQPIVLSLFVRVAGNTQLAVIDAAALNVTVTPAAAVTTELSADRHFVVITPTTGFVGDGGGNVAIHVTGDVLTNLTRAGLVFTGGTPGGSFDQTFTFAVTAASATPFPLAVPAALGDPATTWELYRIAAPLPTMLPSYNQIGFDSLHFLVGMVEPGVAWVVGGTLAPDNSTIVDPATKSAFALGVTDVGGALTLDNTAGFSLEVMGAKLTFDRFRISTRLSDAGAIVTPPQLGVSAICADIQLYGPFLATLGLCNPQTGVLLVSGALLVRPWDGGVQTGPSAAEVGAVAFAVTGGQLVATVTGGALVANAHALGVLLVDAATGVPVSMDYGLVTTRTANADGTLASVAVTLTGSEPAQVRAYLMVDTYPAAVTTIALGEALR